ncbi:hypothetical protein EYC84_002959 [Monilinia fructicola]|uniref:Uncharacterized protein n=1 Tax=Monilinia fructicola TaxID=38448 RepID=A0A5M9K0A0_MONFR|nr:hypothetical protein EYC84_002959 [Monilinia fructicola]
MDDLTKPPAVDVKSSTDHSNKDPRLFNAGPINGRYMSLIPPSLNHPQPKTPQDRFKNAPHMLASTDVDFTSTYLRVSILVSIVTEERKKKTLFADQIEMI